MSEEQPVTAICPGTYDPVTFGHLDVITRAADDLRPRRRRRRPRAARTRGRCSRVEERVGFLREALADARERRGRRLLRARRRLRPQRWGAKTMVKGLRVISDFEWEFQMNHLNRTLAPDIETHVRDGEPAVQLRLVERREGDRVVRRKGGRARAEAVARRLRELFPDGRPERRRTPSDASNSNRWTYWF